MSEDDRRSSEPGRREDDRRWLKVQEQIMNLVTAERTDQQVLTSIKMEVAKLSDHIEEIDDHLRGVSGHESMDSRVLLLERESTGNTILLHQIKKQLEALQSAVSSIQIYRAIDKEAKKTRAEHFSEWLKFWGPIIIATIALIVPITNVILEHIARTKLEVKYRPDERLRKQIEEDKRSHRAKEIQTKLHEMEKIQKNRS